MNLEDAVISFWDSESTPTDMLGYVLSVAKGGGASEHIWDWDDHFTLNAAQLLCNRLHLPYTGVLKEDINRVHNGLPPIYFMEHSLWVSLYQQRHGVTYVPPAPTGLRHISEIDTENLVARIESGFVTIPRDLGWACPREQQYFYQTDEWKNCAKAYRYIDGYSCWRCGRRDVPLDVHHRTPIVSAYHHNFRLNFAWWKLETTCRDCHVEIHLHTVRGVYGYGYDYVASEQVREEKGWLRRAWFKHHQDKVCGWCNEHPETDKEEVYFG